MMAKTFTVYGQKREQGFSLIEIMVAMGIGIIISAGVFEIFLTSKKSQDLVYDQVELMDESRITVEMLSYDLKKAGLWGKTNHAEVLWENTAGINAVAAKLATANDCATTKANWSAQYGGRNMGWSLDAFKSVYGVSELDIQSNGFPYTNCIEGSYLAGDVLEMRYAGEKITPDNLDTTTVYIISQGQHSDVFYGAAPAQPFLAVGKYTNPLTDPPVTYHKYEAVLYYVSEWTNGNAGSNDGIPSLRRVSLQAGPELKDDVVLSGVENLRVQFGLDLDRDEKTISIQRYFDAANITETAEKNDWSKIRSTQTWALIKSKHRRQDNIAQTFTVPGGAMTIQDGYKRIMVSNATRLRNVEYADE